eukprot:gene3861-4397_t
MVLTWVKTEQKITDAAVDKHRKMMKKIRPSTRHKQVFVKLYQKFLQARSKEMRISFASRTQMLGRLTRNSTKAPNQMLKSSQNLQPSILQKKHKIKLRRIQRKKRAEETSFLPGMIGWHTILSEGLIKIGSTKPSYDSKWGRFRPCNPFNVDQVQMPFAIDCKTTYEKYFTWGEQRNNQTRVCTLGPQLDRRQCTLRVCLAPVGQLVKTQLFSVEQVKESAKMKNRHTTKTWMFTGRCGTWGLWLRSHVEVIGSNPPRSVAAK